MKQLKIVTLAILVTSAFSFGQTPKENKQSGYLDNWKTIDEVEYTIQYPDSFDLNSSGQMGVNFFLLSKQISQEDLFRENINLIIQDLSGQNIDLDKFVEISEEQIKTMITNSDLIESRRIKLNNSEYQKVIYTGVQGQFNLKYEQYYWVVKSKAYILTLTCELDQFENYKEVGEIIMNSFKIK